MTKKVTGKKDNIFFTSDLHFFHHNIIRYCKRPFKSAAEMNEALVANWNATVPVNGTVFIIGDVSFGKLEETVKILDRLHGSKYLIAGNHDSHFLQQPTFRKCFVSIDGILEVTVEDEERNNGKSDFVLCHYAMRVWNKSHHGAFQLYGHSHSTLPPLDLQLDVGVDGNNFYPYTYDDVLIKIWENLCSTPGTVPGFRRVAIDLLDSLKKYLLESK